MEEMVQWYRGGCLDPTVWKNFVRPRVNPAVVPDSQDFEGQPPASLELPPIALQGFSGLIPAPAQPALPPSHGLLQRATHGLPQIPAPDSSYQVVRKS